MPNTATRATSPTPPYMNMRLRFASSSARRCVARCFGALTRGLLLIAAGECSSSPGCARVAPAPSAPLSTVRRPYGRSRSPRAGSRDRRRRSRRYLAVRPALAERRRRIDDVISLERSLAAARAELAVERDAFDDRLAAKIKTMSAEALDANSARFLELADTRLSGYVRPLKESLERMDNQLQSVERIRQEAYGKLTESVGLLRGDHDRLRVETGNLVTALRAPHVRGRWGEIQLRRRDRDGRDDRALRLRRAAVDDRRGRERPAAGRHRATSRREADRHRLEGAARRVSRRGPRRRHRRRAPREARGPCSSRARAHPSARPEGVLAAAARDAGVRGHVPPGRDVPQGRARAGLVADRARGLQQRHPGVARRTSSACSVPSTTAGSRRRSRRARAR